MIRQGDKTIRLNSTLILSLCQFLCGLRILEITIQRIYV